MTAARGAHADDDPLGVVSAFAEDRVHAVHVGPLSQDALERVLRAKVGEGFSRTTLLSLHEMSGGNPFFAQEIGLALLRRGGDVTAGERPPIPDRLQELIEDRLEGLPARTVEALEVVSALSAPTLDAIAAAIAPSAGRRSPGPGASTTASWRSSATGSGSPTPSSLPPSIRRSRRLGVASCTRGSRRSSAIRRNEPATWRCPSRARTSPSPPPSRRPPCWPLPGERRSRRPSSGRWPAAPRRGIEARTWCVGPTRRAWRTTSAGTPRWRGASWSKRWTSRWPGRLGPACCWTWGWASPRPKGGGGPGPCSRLLGARRGTISRCGH